MSLRNKNELAHARLQNYAALQLLKDPIRVEAAFERRG